MEAPGILVIPEIGRRIALRPSQAPSRTILAAADPAMAYMNPAKVRFPLVIRNARPGDRFQPLGMTGTQKLKSFFINRKLASDQRWRCPVVICDQIIVWVAGHRIAESAKMTAGVSTALKGELFLA